MDTIRENRVTEEAELSTKNPLPNRPIVVLFGALILQVMKFF